MKPVNPLVATPNYAIIDEFVAYKKYTRGLTPRGEQWLRDMTGRFLRQLRMNLTDVGPQQIIEFLGPYSAFPKTRSLPRSQEPLSMAKEDAPYSGASHGIYRRSQGAR